jgi:hypothetical protein
MPTCPEEFEILPCGTVKKLNIEYSIAYAPDQFEVEYGLSSEWPLGTTVETINPPFTNPLVISQIDACGPLKVSLTPICGEEEGTPIVKTINIPATPTLKITPGECDPVTGIQSFLIERYNSASAVSFYAILKVEGNIEWDNAGGITSVLYTYASAIPPAIADGTYTAISQSATTGEGTGAVFTITFLAGAITNVTITTPGDNYAVGDTITINGTSFPGGGGTTPDDNVTLTITGITSTRTCSTGAWVAGKLYSPVDFIEKDVVSPLVTSVGSTTPISMTTVNQGFVADSLVLYTQVVGYNTKQATSSITSTLIITELNTINIPDHEVMCSNCSVELKSGNKPCLTPLPPIPTPGS